ncbi:unnamed protein product, partial [Linum tenue]
AEPAGGGGEDESQVNEEQHEVEQVGQGLEKHEAEVSGSGGGVEETQRLEPRGQSGEREDGEVDGEVDLDEDEELLEGEVGLDSVDDEGDEEERNEDEGEGDEGSDRGGVFVPHVRLESFGDFLVGLVQVLPGGQRDPLQVGDEVLVELGGQISELRHQIVVVLVWLDPARRRARLRLGAEQYQLWNWWASSSW